MQTHRFQHVFNVRLSEPEREFLTRRARENDRSRAGELRQLLRREMQNDTIPQGPPFQDYAAILGTGSPKPRKLPKGTPLT
jgi:hypothetical protein